MELRSITFPALVSGLVLLAGSSFAEDGELSPEYLYDIGVAAASVAKDISEEKADDCLFAFDWMAQAKPDSFAFLAPFAKGFWGSFHDIADENATDEALFATEWQQWVKSAFTPEGEAPVKGAPSAKKMAKSIRKKNDKCFNIFYPYFDEGQAIVDARDEANARAEEAK